jgi:hypothetical protein
VGTYGAIATRSTLGRRSRAPVAFVGESPANDE